MGDTLVLDFQTNLLKTMEQVNKTLAGTNDLLSKNQKNLSRTDDQVEKMRDYYSDIERKQKNINSLTEKFGKLLSGVGNILKSIAGGLLAVFSIAGIIDIIKATMHYQQTFMDLSARMGQGQKAAGAYTGALHGIVQATGISVERSEALVKTLGEFRIPIKDIRELGIATARFAEITGMSDAMASKLTGELSRTGKVGKEGIKSVLFQMMNVQKVVGLTEQEMEQLGDVVITNTKLLHQMGKSESEIAKFSKSTSMLVGAFSKVGLSIQDAQGVLEKFLDPTQFEDSAFMFAKLGYSLSDVMDGVIPGPELAGRLKELGQQVKGMKMAGVDMAKSLGMPYQTLKQMADLPLEDLSKALTENGGDINKAMAAAQSSQTGLGKSLDHTTNRVQDAGSQLADNVMPALTKAAKTLESIVASITSNINRFIKPALIIGLILAVAYVIYKVIDNMKARTIRASIDTSTVMQKGITGAMQMGSAKGADLMKKRTEIANREMSEDYKRRVMESAGYSERMMKSEYFQMMTQVNSGSGGKMVAKNTAEWLKHISMGSKPVSAILMSTQQHNAAIRDRLEMTRRDNALIKNSLDFKKEYYKSELDGLNNSIGKLQSRENLTNQEKEALKEMLSQQDKLNNQYDKISAQKERFGVKAEAREQAQLNKLSTAQLVIMREERQVSIQTLESDRMSLMNQKAMSIAEFDALKAAQNTLLARKQELAEKSQLVKLSATEVQELLETSKLEKQIAQEVGKAEKELGDQEEKIRGMNAELEKEKKLMTQINSARGMAGRTATEVESNKFGYKIANLVGSVLRDAGSAISNVGNKISNNLQTRLESLKEHLSPGNIAAGLKSGLSGLTKGMAALGGSLIVMTLLRPIIEKMRPAIEQVQKALMPLVDKFLPIILRLLNAFLPLFALLINTLMPPLLDMFAFLLTILNFLIKGIAGLASKLGAKGLADGLDKVTSGLDDAVSGLRGVAKDIRDKPFSFPAITIDGAVAPRDSPASSAPSLSGTTGVPATYNAGKNGFQKIAASVSAQKQDESIDYLKDISENTKNTAKAVDVTAQKAIDPAKKVEYIGISAPSTSGVMGPRSLMVGN